MKVLFLHGFGSDPGGIRPTFLKQSGHDVSHPAMPDDDFSESVRIAQTTFDEARPEVVVGSSRGGAVALHMDLGNVPMVLIAPASERWAPTAKVPPGTIIIHSEHDDIVPIAGSRELLRRSGLSEDHLIVVGEDHRMVDKRAFEALLDAIKRAGG